MKQELLEKMLDAGFTKNEIMELIHGTTAAAQETAPETAPENPSPVENQETAPENPFPENPSPETAQETAPDSMETRMAGIEKNIADLVKAMQLANLRNDSFDNPAESLEQKTDEAMADIIRPNVKERK